MINLSKILLLATMLLASQYAHADHNHNESNAPLKSYYENPRNIYYGEVVDVTEHVQTSTRTYETCQDVTVQQPQSGYNWGTGIGTIAGGLIGSRFGNGTGKIASVIGGGVLGGYVGNSIYNSNNRTANRVCTQHSEPIKILDGYNVTLKYKDLLIKEVYYGNRPVIGSYLPVQISIK